MESKLIFSDIENKCFKKLETSVEDKSLDNNEKIEDRLPALYVAIENNQLEVTKFLLERGADVDATYGERSYLYCAVEKNCGIDLIKLLLSYVIDIDKANDYKCSTITPLLLAIHQSNYEVTELLLQHGADPNKGYQLPLLVAIGKQNVALVKLLLNYGARLNCCIFPFAFCQEFVLENIDLIKICFRNLADVVLERDYDGSTVLHHAVRYLDAEFVERLLHLGADVNATDDDGRTPLQYLIDGTTIGARIDMLAKVKLLVGRGARVNCLNRDGEPLLHQTVLLGETEIVEYLLSHGAVIDSEDYDSPILLAVRFDRVKIAECLISKGARLDVKDKNGYTLFYLALKYSTADSICWKMVQLLMENGVILNEDDYLGLDEDKRPNLVAHQRELEAMKVTRVCENYTSTYSDLMLKRGKCLTHCLSGDKIREITDSKIYRKMFPLFSDRLEANLSRGFERLKMLDDLTDALYTIFVAKLPCEAIEVIFKYFVDEELNCISTLWL